MTLYFIMTKLNKRITTDYYDFENIYEVVKIKKKF